MDGGWLPGHGAATEVGFVVKLRLGPLGELYIHVSGAFDAGAAAQLERCLLDRPACAPVAVDFTRAEPLDGAGVAAAARVLAGVAGLSLHGLAWHQLRLLRYCGVEVIPPPAWVDD